MASSIITQLPKPSVKVSIDAYKSMRSKPGLTERSIRPTDYSLTISCPKEYGKNAK